MDTLKREVTISGEEYDSLITALETIEIQAVHCYAGDFSPNRIANIALESHRKRLAEDLAHKPGTFKV